MPELPPKPAGAVTGWSRQLLVARPRFEFPATVGRRLHETDFAPHVRNDGRSVGPDPLAPTTCGVAPSVGPTSRLSGQKRLDQLLQPLNHDGWWRVFGSLRARQTSRPRAYPASETSTAAAPLRLSWNAAFRSPTDSS
jgi:hypothetical protein